jgi:hypothetical protein
MTAKKTSYRTLADEARLVPGARVRLVEIRPERPA